MTMHELFNICGDMDDNSYFEFHPMAHDDEPDETILWKGFWKSVPGYLKESKVTFYNSMSFGRFWIEVE